MSKSLIARRNSLVLKRRSLLLKAKSLNFSQIALKAKINKEVRSLTTEIAELNRLIALENYKKKKIGLKPVVTPTVQSQVQPNFKGKLQDPVFKPSVVKPTAPVVSLPSVVPTKPPVTQSPMPQFEVETFEAEEIEAPIEEPSMMDTYLDWLDDNKLYVGLGVVIGSYLLLRGKKKPKSNPKRRRLKSKSRKSKVRKVRKNKRRSGYHRS